MYEHQPWYDIECYVGVSLRYTSYEWFQSLTDVELLRTILLVINRGVRVEIRILRSYRHL